ncbi:hypothetical protein ABW19_dt0209241 [Dactylella cylindrospora]|nr:hypothetical protein ABW19_dt0209241 [Dactylella cylindrospora]
MGQLPSHIPIPTAEERTEMLLLLGELVNISGKAIGLGFTEEQLEFLYSLEYVPPNHDSEIMTLTVIVIFWLVTSTSLRFYSRWKFGARTGPLWDDWLVLFATIVCIMYTIVTMYAFLWAGFGRHGYDLSIKQYNHCLKLIIVNFTAFAVANTAVKVSILVLYRRIFDSMQTRMRRVVYILIGIVILFCPVSIIVQVVTCRPFSAFWHLEARLDPNVKCDDTAIPSYLVGVIRALLDIIIFALPLKHIWDIKSFPTRKKIAVTAIFTLGLTACIASILKLALYPAFLQGDIIRGAFKVVIVESLEYTCAIVAACVPALLPMLKALYRNTTSTIRQIKSGSQSQAHTATTHVGTGPINRTESIKLKGIKVLHVVSQTIEIDIDDDEDGTELILQVPDPEEGKYDKDSKASYIRS